MAKRRKASKRKARGNQTCFVIMPFGLPYDRYYNNIMAPAVVDANLEPLRADSLFRSSNIVADIWKLTRESSVLLADLSGKNPNVFYELGLAHALGKPVVLTASTIDDVPFDLRGLRVLIYDREDEAWGAKLQEGITKALSETLADVAGAIPSPFVNASRPPRPEEAPIGLEFRRVWEELHALRSQFADGRSLARPAVITTNVRPTPEALALVPPIKRKATISRRPELLSVAREEILAPLLTHLLAGNYINGIKLIREHTGLGLAPSKDIVDRMRFWLNQTGHRTPGVDG
jgi:hypothetical protein